jgi:hypothetical protein
LIITRIEPPPHCDLRRGMGVEKDRSIPYNRNSA